MVLLADLKRLILSLKLYWNIRTEINSPYSTWYRLRTPMFIEICYVVSVMKHADGQTDGLIDFKKRTHNDMPRLTLWPARVQNRSQSWLHLKYQRCMCLSLSVYYYRGYVFYPLPTRKGEEEDAPFLQRGGERYRPWQFPRQFAVRNKHGNRKNKTISFHTSWICVTPLCIYFAAICLLQRIIFKTQTGRFYKS